MLSWTRYDIRILSVLVTYLCLAIPSANAQQTQPSVAQKGFPPGDEVSKEAGQFPKEERSRGYQRWLDEDVRWIISDEERKAFNQLTSDQERDQFIDVFWQRRDPTPDTVENEYRDEHYRRIVFANEQFASFIPGWRTDRGRFYIMYGPPDEIESHASGGTYTSPFGGQIISNVPFEVWRYSYLEGLGQDVVLPFADICNCGDYRLTEGGGSHYVAGADAVIVSNLRQPHIRFKDLEELVAHKIDVRMMPFALRTDFVRATDFTVMVPITLRVGNREIAFTRTGGVERGTINIFGRVTAASGHVVESFEDTVQVDVPHEVLLKAMTKATFYQNVVLLRPGQYRLDIVVRDVNGDRVGTSRLSVQVPEFEPGEMTTSSLVLSDKMGPASQENAPGTGHFLVGKTYVRPLVPAAEGRPINFSRDQNINVWMQVYELAVDRKTNRPSVSVEYDVAKVANGKVEYDVAKVTDGKTEIHILESTDDMGNIGDQMTLKKALSTANLQPGEYNFRIKVHDNISHQVFERSTTFSVE
jgi:GWxTD domain-containing protein